MKCRALCIAQGQVFGKRRCPLQFALGAGHQIGDGRALRLKLGLVALRRQPGLLNFHVLFGSLVTPKLVRLLHVKAPVHDHRAGLLVGDLRIGALLAGVQAAVLSRRTPDLRFVGGDSRQVIGTRPFHSRIQRFIWRSRPGLSFNGFGIDRLVGADLLLQLGNDSCLFRGVVRPAFSLREQCLGVAFESHAVVHAGASQIGDGFRLNRDGLSDQGLRLCPKPVQRGILGLCLQIHLQAHQRLLSLHAGGVAPVVGLLLKHRLLVGHADLHPRLTQPAQGAK